MVGYVKAFPVSVHASVGSMDDFHSGDHHENGENGEGTPNELTFPPKTTCTQVDTCLPEAA
jgi:hypothetical protein